jgi:hypothetical protein
MNGKVDALESFLMEKEKVLMDKCMTSPFIISENDVLAKHYSLIDAEIGKYKDFIVSTQWRVRDTVRNRFDLVLIKKWTETYAHTKECFTKNLPYYAVEYKIDDEPGTYGKGHQPTDFKKDVIRLATHCNYIQRAFALYYYRGPIKFEGNVFDKTSSNYLFKNTDEISNKEKLNVFFVDKRGIYKLDLR